LSKSVPPRPQKKSNDEIKIPLRFCLILVFEYCDKGSSPVHGGSLIIQAAGSSGAAVVYSENLADGQTYGPLRVVNPLNRSA
jgi:hypothetical protein